MGPLELAHEPGLDADHMSPGRERRIGECPHRTHTAPAVNDRISGIGKRFSKFASRCVIGGVATSARSAENEHLTGVGLGGGAHESSFLHHRRGRVDSPRGPA